MNKGVKTWLLIAAAAIISGAIFMGVAMLMGADSFYDYELFGINYSVGNLLAKGHGNVIDDKITFTKKETDSVEDIEIDWGIGTLSLVEWNRNYIEVEYSYADSRAVPQFAIKNGKLTVSSEPTFSIINIGFSNFKETKAIVYIPSDMTLKNLETTLNAGKLDITAPVYVSDKADVTLNAGNMHIENMFSDKKVKIKINAGDAEIEGCLKGELHIKINAGSLDLKNSASLSKTSSKISTNAGKAVINGREFTGASTAFEEIKPNAENILVAEINAGTLNAEFSK